MAHVDIDRLISYMNQETSPRETTAIQRHLEVCHECRKWLDVINTVAQSVIDHTPGDACLDDDQLNRYHDGTMTVHERRAVEAHLASCHLCLHKLVDFHLTHRAAEAETGFRLPPRLKEHALSLQQSTPSPDGHARPVFRPWPLRPRWIIALVSGQTAVILVLVGFWLQSRFTPPDRTIRMPTEVIKAEVRRTRQQRPTTLGERTEPRSPRRYVRAGYFFRYLYAYPLTQDRLFLVRRYVLKNAASSLGREGSKKIQHLLTNHNTMSSSEYQRQVRELDAYIRDHLTDRNRTAFAVGRGLMSMVIALETPSGRVPPSALDLLALSRDKEVRAIRMSYHTLKAGDAPPSRRRLRQRITRYLYGKL